MRKKLLILTLILFLPLCSFSQKQGLILDSLYHNVTMGQIRPNDIEKTITKVESTLKSKSLTTTERLKAMLIYANLHKLKGDHKTSLDIAQKACNFAQQRNEYLWSARFLGYISSLYRVSKMLDLSQDKLKQAIQWADKAPASQERNKFYANAYHEMAYNSASKNDFAQSIDYIEQSNYHLSNPPSANNDFLLASNYQYMGDLFNQMMVSDSAIHYTKKSLNYMLSSSDINRKTLQNFALTSLATSYLLKQDLDSCQQVIFKVLEDSAQYKPINLNHRLYTNLVQYYEYRKDIDSMRVYKHKLDSISIILSQTQTDAINAVTNRLHVENSQLKNQNGLHKWYFLLLLIPIAFLFLWKKRANKPTEQAPSTNTVKSDHVKIAKETQDRLIEQIKIFEQEELFLNKNISSSVMANDMNTNAKYITYILNNVYKQDFNTYINTLRINYITDLLDNDPDYRQYKISYLAEISGFSSHSKFAEVFKKVKGCTPSQYIQNISK